MPKPSSFPVRVARDGTVVAIGIAVAAAAVLGTAPWNRPALRVARNALGGGWYDPPAALSPVYASTDGHDCRADLAAALSVVVTVKDTCSQGAAVLLHLSAAVPSDVAVAYVTPDAAPCRAVAPRALVGRLFPRRHAFVEVAAEASPFAAFLAVRDWIDTPQVLLMHNDVYALDAFAVCELSRALHAHPEAPLVAPQLYERGDNEMLVPHGHHRWLRGVVDDGGEDRRPRLAYDLDFDLLTRRVPRDFEPLGGAPQCDFVEDHAFAMRTRDMADVLDPDASFTLEYLDVALALRARGGGCAHYVPTARFVFDVDARRVAWQDVGYVAWKRSTEVGIGVLKHMRRKWCVQLPSTAIWDYVRESLLGGAALRALPADDDDAGHRQLARAWLQAAGFNRFRVGAGDPWRPLFEAAPGAWEATRLLDDPHDDAQWALACNGSRTRGVVPWTRRDAERDVTAPPLPWLLGRTFPPLVPRIGVTLRTDRDACGDDARTCPLLLAHADGTCTCGAHRPTVHARPWHAAVTWLLDRARLPSRAWLFAAMARDNDDDDEAGGTEARVEAVCDAHDGRCRVALPFAAGTRVVRWSW